MSNTGCHLQGSVVGRGTFDDLAASGVDFSALLKKEDDDEATSVDGDHGSSCPKSLLEVTNGNAWRTKSHEVLSTYTPSDSISKKNGFHYSLLPTVDMQTTHSSLPSLACKHIAKETILSSHPASMKSLRSFGSHISVSGKNNLVIVKF